MPASNVSLDSFFRLRKGLSLWRPFGEQGSMHVIGRKRSRFSDDDPISRLMSFAHSSGSSPEPATDLGGDRDLSWCREPRLSDSHTCYSARARWLRQGVSGISLTGQEERYGRVEFEY